MNLIFQKRSCRYCRKTYPPPRRALPINVDCCVFEFFRTLGSNSVAYRNPTETKQFLSTESAIPASSERALENYPHHTLKVVPWSCTTTHFPLLVFSALNLAHLSFAAFEILALADTDRVRLDPPRCPWVERVRAVVPRRPLSAAIAPCTPLSSCCNLFSSCFNAANMFTRLSHRILNTRAAESARLFE